MARRTKVEAQVTRERLLDAAESIFRERGVTRTSLAEIATAAGLTRGAVYWHFRDKADLFRAMCDRATLPLDAMFERAGEAAAADPLGMLRALSIGALQSLAGDQRAQKVFEIVFHKSELVDELADLASAHRDERRVCLARIEDIMRRCAAVGQLAADLDARLATQGLHALMVGIMHEWVLDPAAYDLGAAAPALIDTYLAGLRHDPPREACAFAAADAAVRETRHNVGLPDHYLESFPWTPFSAWASSAPARWATALRRRAPRSGSTR
ncbi:MAG: TetR family transcriptional regulator [Casimicrobiaceae bacterium]